MIFIYVLTCIYVYVYKLYLIIYVYNMELTYSSENLQEKSNNNNKWWEWSAESVIYQHLANMARMLEESIKELCDRDLNVHTVKHNVWRPYKEYLRSFWQLKAYNDIDPKEYIGSNFFEKYRVIWWITLPSFRDDVYSVIVTSWEEFDFDNKDLVTEWIEDLNNAQNEFNQECFEYIEYMKAEFQRFLECYNNFTEVVVESVE